MQSARSSANKKISQPGTWQPARTLLQLCAALAIALGILTLSPAFAEDSVRGPDVVVIAGESRTVYEFRQNGQLRMVRVVPKWGKPYNLVPADPTKGGGDLEKSDMLVPSWVIVEF